MVPKSRRDLSPASQQYLQEGNNTSKKNGYVTCLDAWEHRKTCKRLPHLRQGTDTVESFLHLTMQQWHTLHKGPCRSVKPCCLLSSKLYGLITEDQGPLIPTPRSLDAVRPQKYAVLMEEASMEIPRRLIVFSFFFFFWSAQKNEGSDSEIKCL